MQRRAAVVAMFALVSLVIGVQVARAENVTLNQILYPEATKTDVKFTTTDRAPKATLSASVKPEAGQSWVDIKWSKLEPALLFGGDINCWVLWTVTPDGTVASQGELPVRNNRSGSARFSVPYKQFAMMVTAEPFPVVRRPSTLVAFVSEPAAKSKMAKNSTSSFDGFRPETKHDQESIATLKYKEKDPVELQQARKSVQVMDRLDATKYAPDQAQEARTSLTQAEDAYNGRVGKKKDVPELAARTMSLTNQAVRSAVKAIDEQKAQAKEAGHLAELAQKQAETEAEKAARLKTEADLAEVEKQRQALKVEVANVQAQKTQVEGQREQMRKERDALASRLSGALGKVATTERTGRGLVVSLSSGILFATGKSDLKEPAKVSLAKLSGILMMIPNTNIQIEGHTDSTGTPETNAKLSEARAGAVREFLKGQGVEEARMSSRGMGPDQPVASNDTADGRAKNRRVEIVVPDMQAQAGGMN